MAEERVRRRLAAILAADVVGYSRMMSRDESGTLSRLKALRAEVFNPKTKQYGGRIFKITGDGALVEFHSAVEAVNSASDIQKVLAARNAKAAENERVELRIGISLGDVIVEGSDLYGNGVNVASRMEGLAEPGGICVSGNVHEHVDGSLDVYFEDLGEQAVKNIDRPVRCYRVRAAATGAAIAPSLPLPNKPSVAVLPFENLSGDPDQEYFSDGITEDIITEISKISGIFVIGRHSAFTFKGKSATLRQIGCELGVKYVLEGSVRKAGDRLRISSQLVDASIDQQLWAERFDRELEDIFAVQEEVARSVASALEVVLKPDEGPRLSRVPTENLEAYDLYLRTRTTLWPPTRENLLTARSAYLRITEKDPAFSGGFAGQSMTHSLPVIFVCSDQPADDARLALELAYTAVELGPEFALSHSALALAHTVAEQYDSALESAREAVKLQPGDPDILAYSAWPRFFAGCADEAYDAVTAANRLDPNYVGGPYLNILGITCFCAERYEEAITAFRKNIERGGPLGAPAVVFHTAACSAAGRTDDASAMTQDIFKFCPDFTLSTYRMLHLFKNQSDSDRVIGALRKIGLPE